MLRRAALDVDLLPRAFDGSTEVKLKARCVEAERQLLELKTKTWLTPRLVRRTVRVARFRATTLHVGSRLHHLLMRGVYSVAAMCLAV